MRGAEAADVPSPRTRWSISNQKELATWLRCHSALLTDARSWSVRGQHPHRRRIVLFGDSITESWRGTSYGVRVGRTSGVPAVLNSTLGVRWPNPLPLGIAADCTQHLLWRMQQGELSAAMRSSPRVSFVLLIGTNNLGRGHSIDETARGVLASAEFLLNATRGRVLVNALLPRGDRRKRGSASARKRGYLVDIKGVNDVLDQQVNTRLGGIFPSRVRFVDCGRGFLLDRTQQVHSSSSMGASIEEVVRRDLMPDRLHPNAAGHRLWARCLEEALAARW
jgi:lysophospholipase L1-like esterase